MKHLLNRRIATVLVAGLFGVLAALPAASASASSSASGVPLQASTGVGSPDTATLALGRWLTPTEAEKLLEGLPIGKGVGAISPEALAKALAGLPGLQALDVGHLEESLKSTLEGLGSGATLEDLKNPTSLVATLETTLDKLLSLPELLKLEGLLGGEPLGLKLEEALTKVEPSELLAELLGSSSKPEALLEELLGVLPAELVESILGEGLGGGPLSSMTVSELAADLGITVKVLLEQIGETASQLPETKEILLDPLANGEVLSVLDGTNRIVLGTLSSLLDLEGKEGSEGEEGSKGTPGEEGKEGAEGKEGSKGTPGEEGKGTEGSKGGSGEGGSGGSGGTSGSGGSAGTGTTGTTLVVNVPPSTATPATPAAPATKAKTAKVTVGKIVVLKHSVHGIIARIVVKTPGAGKLKASNRDVQPVNRNVGAARELSFKVVLSRAGAATAHRHAPRAMTVKLRIAFAPSDGARSQTTVKLRFR
jgi:hypothetical protein